MFNRNHEGKESILSKNNLKEMLGKINFKITILDWLTIAKSVNESEPWMAENGRTNKILRLIEKEMIEKEIL
ncbi:hypothetical protein [Mesoplasma melaleucae]|uniref:hypothetical protein n=1 Tax=Mesoplasma melaleucae TaxID=81459 RepID=UPI0004821658|nr:hypothetical protein [Mesoplasma melaleucae]